MKQPLKKTRLNIKKRSKEALTGLTQKTKALFVARPDSEAIESRDLLDKGTQRLAQTPFGRTLLHWSQPRQKRKRKRRVSIVNLIFLAFFAAMVAISLWGTHNSASAATTKTQAASIKKAASLQGTAVSTWPNGKCPDGTTQPDSNSHCPPASFDITTCPQQRVGNDPMSDTCNPWGQESTTPDVNKATIWENVTPNDRACIWYSSNANDAHNADITQRYTARVIFHKDGGVDTKCVSATTGQYFYCVQDEATLATDWLSGETTNTNTGSIGGPGMPSTGVLPGHLSTTYLFETLNQPNVLTLYPYTLGLGIVLLVPTVVLAGYQLLLSGSTFRHAEALSVIPRIAMAVAAVFICYDLIGFLINNSNILSGAIVQLHNTVPYPDPETVTDLTNGRSYIIGYKLAVGDPKADPSDGTQEAGDGTVAADEPADSYRGVVMPVGRWGCAGNDFASIVATEFWTNIVSGFIPFFGQMANLIAKVEGAIAIVHHLGEFIEAILSIGLAAQVVFRIFMINFYIVTGPLACGCWGLPGGAGQKVFGQWLKGLLSLLFTQAAQLFVLTVTPLLMPDLGKIGVPIDTTGFLSSLLAALPVIVVLYITLQVPKFLGTSATKAVGSAGTMASGAVAAGAAAAYSIAG